MTTSNNDSSTLTIQYPHFFNNTQRADLCAALQSYTSNGTACTRSGPPFVSGQLDYIGLLESDTKTIEQLIAAHPYDGAWTITRRSFLKILPSTEGGTDGADIRHTFDDTAVKLAEDTSEISGRPKPGPRAITTRDKLFMRMVEPERQEQRHSVSKIEIDSSRVHIVDEDWAKDKYSSLDEVVKRACKGLGIKDGTEVQAKIDRVLMQRPNYKDPNAVFTMAAPASSSGHKYIGKLIVQLPSAYQTLKNSDDGIITVSNQDGQCGIFDLSKHSIDSFQYIAFPSGGSIQINPPADGVALYLIYDITSSSPQPQSSALERSPKSLSSQLQTFARNWDVKRTPACFQMFLLDRTYSLAGLSFKALKGRDLSTVNEVLNAKSPDSDEPLYHVALARLEHTQEGSPDYEIADSFTWRESSFDYEHGPSDKTTTIKSIVLHDEEAPNGERLVKTKKQSLITVYTVLDLLAFSCDDEDIFGISPLREEIASFATLKHTYHRFVAIFFPRDIGNTDWGFRGEDAQVLQDIVEKKGRYGRCKSGGGGEGKRPTKRQK